MNKEVSVDGYFEVRSVLLGIGYCWSILHRLYTFIRWSAEDNLVASVEMYAIRKTSVFLLMSWDDAQTYALVCCQW